MTSDQDRTNTEKFRKRVWLKSTPTPPTIISNLYQLNKQVKQSGEFINIKWMFTHVWTSFESSLKAQMQTVGTRQPTLVRLWLVRATNYGRRYRWWLQSNRRKPSDSQLTFYFTNAIWSVLYRTFCGHGQCFSPDHSLYFQLYVWPFDSWLLDLFSSKSKQGVLMFTVVISAWFQSFSCELHFVITLHRCL